MAEVHDRIEAIRRSATLYDQGIFCPAELWNRITDRLTVNSAATILNGLPTNLQDVLRRAYHDRPWSLRPDECDNDLRQEIERWCKRDEP